MDTNNHSSTPTAYDPQAARRSIGRLVMTLKRLERQPHSFGPAGQLRPAEIHTIDAIGCNSSCLMSELADRLGVTKGAVTQTVDRLEKRGLVRRQAHPYDCRATQVTLTELGQAAYRAHEAVNLAFYDKLAQELSPEEIGIFEKCVAKFCDALQK